MKVWVLKDDRVGSYKQSIALAEYLGFGYEVKEIKYNKFSNLPNFLIGSSLLGIDKKNSSNLSGNPDIVIGAGRKLAPALLSIKKKNQNKPFIIQIMRPNFMANRFDAIILPTHDDCKEFNNVIRMVGALNSLNKDFLKEQQDKWEKTFDKYKKPRIALLVGGSSKKGEFTPEMAKELGETISKLANNMNASVLVTTSRRTSEEAHQELKKNLNSDNIFWYDWRSSEIENPYFGYLACADYIVITGDSLSMCTESCSTGKSVYIYAPEGLCPSKHRKLHSDLYQKGYAREFTSKISILEKFSTEVLNEVEGVGKRVQIKIENYFKDIR